MDKAVSFVKIYYLKKLAFSCFATLLSLVVVAQKDPSATTINKYQILPDFQITAAPDSNLFYSSSLKKNKPVVIIMFNPDCDHCQNETKELLAWRQEIKDLQIVMVSAAPFIKVKEFYQDYNIASLANVKIGCDIEYKLVLTFRASSYPAIYIYDSKGTLSKAFVGGASIPDIIKAATN